MRADGGESVVLDATMGTGLLRLADGRVVRLAGLDTGTLRLPSLGPVDATLVFSGRTDRHGSIRSDLLIDGDSLSERLLREGLGRVRPAAGDVACFTRLLASESAARRLGLGLWGEPGYGIVDASDPDAVARLKDRFAIVTGRVRHVGVAGRFVFIDFGEVWKTDVTVTVLVRDRARFVAAGLDPQALTGQLIRVRGVVTMRGGPAIDVTEPAAIERIATAR